MEFARRHGEVVQLLVTTIEQVNALPERSRDRSLRYIPALWAAIMQPKANWVDNGRPASGIIGEDTLDHLEACADIISGNLVGSAAAPRGADLQEMSDQSHEWLTLLQDMDEQEIPGPVKDALISQIEHLIWLIENAELFGGARVSAEANRVIGSLAQASATMENANPETVSRWKKSWIAFIAICVAFNAGAPVVQESITSGTEIVKEITGVVNDVGRPE
ncbi:hypothetical protein [[Kitasatospora] papulosa]|uniref:hypothetical protein n=1 Tax=[Kitasatospora] papulosa TaxID=1464011 RepID=UPI00368FD11B